MPPGFSLNRNISERCAPLFDTLPSEKLLELVSSRPDLITPDMEIVGANFGQINLIYLVNSAGESVPSKVLVVSRPDKPETRAETVSDYQGLKLVHDNFLAQQAAGQISPTATLPTATPLALIQDKDTAVMINEFVGAETGGSEETFPVLASGNEIYLGLTWIVNPNFTNGANTISGTHVAARIQGLLDLHDAELALNYKQLSDKIAVQNVKALTKVWLLTGRVPVKYCPPAGDGVIVNSPTDEQGDVLACIDLKLITLRGGLSEQELTHAEFIAYLSSLTTEPVVYRDRRGSGLYITHPVNSAYAFWGGAETNVFTTEQIDSGFLEAFTELYGG